MRRKMVWGCQKLYSQQPECAQGAETSKQLAKTGGGLEETPSMRSKEPSDGAKWACSRVLQGTFGELSREEQGRTKVCQGHLHKLCKKLGEKDKACFPEGRKQLE